METTRANLRSVDLMKMVCALIVVGIHTEPFAFSFLLDKAFGVLTRIAVPCFFVASAYFYFSKGCSASSFFKYAGRLFVMYAIWSVIYFCVDLLRGTAYSFTDFLYHFFVYGNIHLWYLHASVISVGLCTLALKYMHQAKIVCVIAGMLYVWGTLQSTYSALLPAVDPLIRAIGARNGLYYAPIYIMMGYWFANHRVRMSYRKRLLLCLASFLFLAAEGTVGVMYFCCSETILWLTTPLVIFMLFSLVLDTQVPVSEKLARFMRRLSVGIYCVHPMVVTVFSGLEIHGIALFCVVAAVSAAVSGVLYLLMQKCGWSFLRWVL